MRVLTLTQPWASFVAAGIKTIETRSWRTAFRGSVAIHAAQQTKEAIEACEEREEFLTSAGLTIGTLPWGAIVAVAIIKDVIPTKNVTVEGPFRGIAGQRHLPDYPALRITVTDYLLGNYAPDRYAWLLADIRKLDEPIQYKGAQGLRHIDADTYRLLAWKGYV